ncbi:MAG: hypothetical protein JNL88_03000 [Bacteroidia bacterium]|nr:hypothetical protein [Bacteroidia bacterium]
MDPKRNKVFSVFLLLITMQLPAQVPSYVWARMLSGNVESIQRGVVTDAAGNVYVTGVFFGTVDFDPGPAVNALTPVPYGCNAYIARYDAAGNFVWVRNVPINASYGNNSIAIDPSGNLYIAGYFTGTSVDFDPGPGVCSVASAGGNDSYLLKLDANGNFIWVRTLGAAGDDRANEVICDPAGNVFLCGNFSATVDFDPGPGNAPLSSAGATDIYLAKFSAAGNYSWAGSAGGSGSEDVRDIAFDASTGSLILCGSFNGSADFDFSSGISTVLSSGGADIFYARYSASGNLSWVKSVGGTGTDFCTAVALSGSGDIFLTGTFNVTVDFDAGSGVSALTAALGSASYLLRCDASGNFQWVKGLPLNTANLDVLTDQYGTVFVSGSYGNINNSVIDMDPGAGTANLNVPSGLPPPYYNILGRYDLNGNYLWAGVFGHTCYCSVAGYKSSMAGSAGFLYYAGIFNGNAFSPATVDFDPGAGVASLTAPSSVDNTFFGKYGISLNPLPVVWLSFRGQVTGAGVMLEWETASEVHNDYFEVERASVTGEFMPIGRVNGQGTTNVRTAYHFTDDEPLNERGYYRLTQVDRDGTRSFSSLIAVEGVLPGACLLLRESEGLYRLSCGLQGRMDYRVLQPDGRLLKQGTSAAQEIRLNDQLPSGWYFIVITGERFRKTFRIYVP